MVKIITDLELGFDCILGVVTEETTDEAIYIEFGDDVGIELYEVKTFSEPSINEVKDIETIDEPENDALYYLLEDSLDKAKDEYKLLHPGKLTLTENDQKILLKLFEEFLGECHPEYEFKGTLIVIKSLIQYRGAGTEYQYYYTSQIKFNDIDDFVAFDEWLNHEISEQWEVDWLLKKKGILLE